jgi:hypothetical protein
MNHKSHSSDIGDAIAITKRKLKSNSFYSALLTSKPSFSASSLAESTASAVLTCKVSNDNH